jgi:hypothetical protein
VLTNEDKQWFEENTRRLTERLEHLIEENTRRLEQRFTEQLAGQQRDVSEKIEKVETTLLTEFHKCASPQEMRQQTQAAIRALDA